ncbi:MAG: PLP-dependent aminotransferase family protein [Anaerolineae bacterium]|nr:PLP-dependent aminotransferase family protein [Anaerolineae bacterium]
MVNTCRYDGQYTCDWDQMLAQRAERMKSSIIRELLKVTLQPDVISFAGGLPAPEFFPIREFREACDYVLQTEGEKALQYGPTEGYPPLKEFLAEKMQKYGVPAEPPNILLTNGSQQALDLIGKVFIDPGTVVVTGRPTYLGAIQAWNAYEARFVTVPLDDDGMQVDLLEEILKREPVRFIYVLPNFHNPAGTTLPLERRIRLAELAAEHGVFIVEDDPYGELRFEGEDITPIVVLHKENTIYLSTFSKTLSPGVRLGWIVAPERVTAKLVQAKQGADLHTSTFIQMVVNDICQRGLLRPHVHKLRQVYRERRDVMLAALEEHFPPGTSWTRPQGGLFLWARLPEGCDSEHLLRVAVEEEKVAFVPGSAFYPDGDGRNAMRLNFSNAQPDVISEGIARLGRAIKRELAK